LGDRRRLPVVLRSSLDFIFDTRRSGFVDFSIESPIERVAESGIVTNFNRSRTKDIDSNDPNSGSICLPISVTTRPKKPILSLRALFSFRRLPVFNDDANPEISTPSTTAATLIAGSTLRIRVQSFASSTRLSVTSLAAGDPCVAVFVDGRHRY
jgi:hypothetical protein